MQPSSDSQRAEGFHHLVKPVSVGERAMASPYGVGEAPALYRRIRESGSPEFCAGMPPSEHGWDPTWAHFLYGRARCCSGFRVLLPTSGGRVAGPLLGFPRVVFLVDGTDSRFVEGVYLLADRLSSGHSVRHGPLVRAFPRVLTGLGV